MHAGNGRLDLAPVYKSFVVHFLIFFRDEVKNSLPQRRNGINKLPQVNWETLAHAHRTSRGTQWQRMTMAVRDYGQIKVLSVSSFRIRAKVAPFIIAQFITRPSIMQGVRLSSWPGDFWNATLCCRCCCFLLLLVVALSVAVVQRPPAETCLPYGFT